MAFFFDIEAGGLVGKYSSILSVAYGGTGQEETKGFYAAPTSGSRVYKWSAKHVWQPIVRHHRKELQTERDIIENLISRLEDPSVREIQGWNIGYFAQPVGSKGELRGFDLPTLATRASKYPGLLNRLTAALQGKQIRDIGQEYAVIAARTILSVDPSKVDKTILEQAKGFRTSLQQAGISLYDTRAAAEYASSRNIKFAGWKQGLMYETMFSEKMVGEHQAVMDVGAGRRLAGLSELEIQKRLSSNIEFWNRRVVYNKLIASTKAGVGEEKAFQNVGQIKAKAAQYGLTSEYEAGLKEIAEDYAVSEDRLRKGLGIGIEQWDDFVDNTFFRPSDRGFSKLGRGAYSFLSKHKLGIGVGLGVGALALLKPGSWFSGRDDAYNTIEGLPERGMAGQLRKQNTDFGSGYQGDEGEWTGKIYRGTYEPVSVHTPQGRNPDKVENIFESIRRQHYPHRPSRLTSTFWSTKAHSAAQWVSSGIGKGATVSETTLQSAGFLTDMEIFTEAVLGQEKDIEEWAHRYWKGMLPSKIDEYSAEEVLLPGTTRAERQWSVVGIGKRWKTEKTYGGEEERWSEKSYKLRSNRTKNPIATPLPTIKSKPYQPLIQIEGFAQKSSVIKKSLSIDKYILGAGALGLLGYALFSGKDDQYNTIEGLPEKGMAGRLRKRNTDFGSGYQGLIQLPQQFISKYGYKKLGIGAGALTGSALVFNRVLNPPKDYYTFEEDLQKRDIEPSFYQGYRNDMSYEEKVKSRWKYLKKALPKHGTYSGTTHKRLLVPKTALSEEQIEETLGFVPVSIAIPEAGESEMRSFRHPRNLYHIHEHGDAWSIHKDRHAALTMMMLRRRMDVGGGDPSDWLTKRGRDIEDIIYGTPHLVTEGLPGGAFYLWGLATGTEGMRTRLLNELPTTYLRTVGGMKSIERPGLIGHSFTARDDGYNIIEGLPERGMAGASRSRNTDFGSGYQDSETSLFTIGKAINYSLFGGLGALTGYDRFGPKGAIVGAGLSVGLVLAGENLSFENKENALGKMLWNIGLQGVISSGTMSMYASSTMKGTLLGKKFAESSVGKKFKEDWGPVIGEEIAEAGGLSILNQYMFGKLGRRIAPDSFKNISEKLFAASQGSPYVFESVLEHGSIKDIPVKEYLTSNLKDLGIGSLAGFIPGTIFGGLTWAFSGKDDEYNTIEGLPDRGMSGASRKRNTDFGSGYQGDDSSRGILDYTLMAGMVGGGAYFGMEAIYPRSLRSIDWSQYQRLAHLRVAGEKHGFSVLSSRMLTISQGTVGGWLFGGLNPVMSAGSAAGFGGVLWARQQASTPPVGSVAVNWGNWDIGQSKTATWKYAVATKTEDLHAPSLLGQEFYEGVGNRATLTTKGRAFIESAGGLENIVLKRADAALGQGVWMNAATLPSEVGEQFLRNPREFLLQEKLGLAAEFRVITAGDKPIYSAHRFGTEPLRGLGRFIQQYLPSARINENVQPILDKKLQARLEDFATQAAKSMPYEIGAFDIGLTSAGDFKIIEAQREFGSITNPIVSRRLKGVITGKMPKLAFAGAGIGAGLGLLAYNLFSGHDDEYNTIEGLPEKGMAGQLRKQNTDFGSGYQNAAKSFETLMSTFAARVGPTMEKFGMSFINYYQAQSAFGKKAIEMSSIAISSIPTVSFGYWLFSGKDDAYNTIEGLPERGMASKLRKRDTDFGSPTNLNKAVNRASNFFRSIGQKFRKSTNKGYSVANIRDIAEMARSSSIEDFAEKLGVDILRNEPDHFIYSVSGGFASGPKEAVSEWYKRHGLTGSSIADYADDAAYVHERASDMVRSNLNLSHSRRSLALQIKQLNRSGSLTREELSAAADQLRFISHAEMIFRKMSNESRENLTKSLIFHESAELKNMRYMAHERPDVHPFQGHNIFSSHQMSISQEELFLRQLGDEEAYSAMRVIRKYSDSYFTGFDDGYNTIEGLRHGGLSSILRQLLTDFGSGWIRRAVSMGMDQHQIAAAARKLGKEIQTSSTGEMFVVGRTIAQGGAGKVQSAQSLMTGKGAVYKTELPDSTLSGVYTGKVEDDAFGVHSLVNVFDRYELSPSTELATSYNKMDETVSYITGHIQRAYKSGRYSNPLHYEAAMQAQAAKEMPGMVPNVLGTTELGFFQEYAGRGLRESEYKEAAEFLKEASKKKTGVIHFDPDPSNMIRSWNGRFMLIDYGVSASRVPQSDVVQTGYEEIVNVAVNKMEKIHSSTKMTSTRAVRPRSLRQKQTQAHQRGMEMVGQMKQKTQKIRAQQT